MFRFPFTNFHELNLDWILSVVKKAQDIFTTGEEQIQHAVDTAEQALETAEHAAEGVISDGSVTISKINDTVYNLMAYIVSGQVNTVRIPVGGLVIIRKSTIEDISDGIYIALNDIPANSIITEEMLSQPVSLPTGGGLNYVLAIVNSNKSETVDSINTIKNRLTTAETNIASVMRETTTLFNIADSTHDSVLTGTRYERDGFYYFDCSLTFNSPVATNSIGFNTAVMPEESTKGNTITFSGSFIFVVSIVNSAMTVRVYNQAGTGDFPGGYTVTFGILAYKL